MKIIHFLQTTAPAYIVSTSVFYCIFTKLIGDKLLNITPYKKAAIILGSGALYIIGVTVTDSFEVTKAYHDIFLGIFMGIIGASIALTTSNKKESK